MINTLLLAFMKVLRNIAAAHKRLAVHLLNIQNLP